MFLFMFVDNYKEFIFNCEIIFSIFDDLAARAKLSGMRIKGTMLAFEYVIYIDPSNITSCDRYGTSGSSVCDDVILIRISSPGQFNGLLIDFSTHARDEISLCEVQVFAGKFLHKTCVGDSTVIRS